ncbi:MAG TPA: hypothetical protein VME46_19340 [Acidimicrobiales bacterium]|nr:hypothetical protein [Acidimicrobiales bacterium]
MSEAAFFDHLRQVGVRGLVAEQLDDSDYVGLGEPHRRTKKSSAQT